MKRRHKNKMKTVKPRGLTPDESTYISDLEELYDKINNRHNPKHRSRPALGTLILVYLFRWYRMLRRLVFRRG